MLPRVRSLLSLTGLMVLAIGHAEAQTSPAYVIRPGDKVTVEVFTAAGERVAVVEGERIVDRVGDVYLPYVGTVNVTGMEHNSIRELLVDEYSRFYSDPVVNVQVLLRVSVTGAVPSPGRYYLDPTTTLLDALSEAGGANTEYAVVGSQIPGDPREVRLVRDTERMTLNMHPTEITDEVIAMRIRSGDWLHVPPEDRTAVRDQILFWGSLISFASGVISLALLIGR